LEYRHDDPGFICPGSAGQTPGHVQARRRYRGRRGGECAGHGGGRGRVAGIGAFQHRGVEHAHLRDRGELEWLVFLLLLFPFLFLFPFPFPFLFFFVVVFVVGFGGGDLGGVVMAGAGVREQPLWAADWRAIGTAIRLVVASEAALPPGRVLLEAELAALDVACSRFREDSELVRLGAAGGRPVRVSPLLAELVAAALQAAETTEGDVDPTVGAAMAAAGYDRDFELVASEGPPVRLVVRRLPNWRDVLLDTDRGLLTVPDGVMLDLGATAKSWLADHAAAALAAELGCGVLVSLGGDIAVAGQPPTQGWRIRVQDITTHPDAPPVGASATVTIRAGGLATSSTTARRWRRGGHVLHHILDPRTGLPAAPVWRTVSVTASTALDANAASTASVIRGEGAPKFLAEGGLAARLVSVGGDVLTVGGWPREVAA